jgi:hypothetical protein
MRLTPVDPRRWTWEIQARLRVDIYRAERDGVSMVEEFVIDDADADIRVVLQELDTRLSNGDSFRLYAISVDEAGDEGLLRLV